MSITTSRIWSFCCFGFAIAALSMVGARGAGAAASPSPVDGIFSKYSSASAPGCAVGVFEKGKVLLARGYGAADAAKQKPLDANVLFYAASVSKQFTSLAAALLVADGKLHLEDDVRKWIPEMPDYGTPITVSMLMHHTSGLRDFLGLLDLAGAAGYDRLDVPTVLRIMTHQRGVSFTPGTQYSYSNGAYFLLGQVVARVSGRSFPEFAKERIFDPLGMSNAYFREGPHPNGADVAHGYVPDEHGGFQFADGYPSVSGSGGLMISLTDLAKYDRDFHGGHKVWSDAVRKIMLTPGTFTNGEKVDVGEGVNYGGGLELQEWRGQPTVHHSGAATGFLNEYWLFPKLKFSAAVFCNRGDAEPARLVKGVIEAYHGKDLTPTKPDAGARELSIADAIVGTFHSDELEADYEFSRDGDGLKVAITSRYAAAPQILGLKSVIFRKPDILTIPFGEVRVERAADGRVSAFTMIGEGFNGIRFVRNTSDKAADSLR
jgi:CubicO group peptidase (beta-lactamase class C family)